MKRYIDRTIIERRRRAYQKARIYTIRVARGLSGTDRRIR